MTVDRAPASRQWALACGLLAAALLALGLSMGATVAATVRVWMNSATYNHGFLIGPIAVWLIWRDRGRLAQISPAPWLWGLVLIGACSMLWLIGQVVTILEAQQFAAVFMIAAIVLTLLGWRVAWATWFALAYLIFLVPTGEWMVPWLQDVTARFAVAVIELVGVPVYGDGVSIEIPEGRFIVAEACAGLRFLVAMLAFGALLAWVSFHSPIRIGLVLLLSVAIPILANGIRVVGIILIGHWQGDAAAVASDHVVYGWGFFTFVMFLLIGVVRLFPEKAPPPPPPAPFVAATGLTTLARAAILATLFSVSGPMIAASLVSGGSASTPAWSPPVASDGWSRADPSSWDPSWPETDALWRAAFGRSGEPAVEIRIGYFSHQRQGASVLGYNSRLADGEAARLDEERRRRVDLAGQPAEVIESRLSIPSGNLQVWRWYVVDGGRTVDPLTAKLWQLRSILPGRDRRAAIVVFATSEDPAAEERLSRFVGGFGHETDRLLRWP